jgi:glycosyltransferase involved in cell wall biosynthesis
MAPLVSVCIPVYNPGKHLVPAIESVLQQSLDDFELIVVDDGSVEPAQAVVAQFADHRVGYCRNPQNLGLVRNWNRCLELAAGKYVTVFHQDDVMLPDNLAAKASMLEGNPDVGFVHSNIVTIDDDGAVTGGHWAPYQPPAGIQTGWEAYESLALRTNYISCPSVMARAECYSALGGFDERLPFTCDMEMWMRIASRYDVGYLSPPLIANRVHPGQTTNRYLGGREILEVKRALDISFAEHMPDELDDTLVGRSDRALMKWATDMARWRASDGHLRPALGYLRAALLLAAHR